MVGCESPCLPVCSAPWWWKHVVSDLCWCALRKWWMSWTAFCNDWRTLLMRYMQYVAEWIGGYEVMATVGNELYQCLKKIILSLSELSQRLHLNLHDFDCYWGFVHKVMPVGFIFVHLNGPRLYTSVYYLAASVFGMLHFQGVSNKTFKSLSLTWFNLCFESKHLNVRTYITMDHTYIVSHARPPAEGSGSIA